MEEVYIKQIEEWTERRINNILFDSDKDDWKENTTVFGERIWNKKHIIIIIEDSEGNKFGGYVNCKIDKVDNFVYDSQSFLFSLESNRMKKFDNKQQQYAFKLFNQFCGWLFAFGCGLIGYYDDIQVYKENNKTKSRCKQLLFEYEGIENELCGKEDPKCFTPKRIIAIEMK
ncbi:trichohyalin, putative [Entamoeba histolytica]